MGPCKRLIYIAVISLFKTTERFQLLNTSGSLSAICFQQKYDPENATRTATRAKTPKKGTILLNIPSYDAVGDVVNAKCVIINLKF